MSTDAIFCHHTAQAGSKINKSLQTDVVCLDNCVQGMFKKQAVVQRPSYNSSQAETTNGQHMTNGLLLRRLVCADIVVYTSDGMGRIVGTVPKLLQSLD